MGELIVIEDLKINEIFEAKGTQEIIALVSKKARDFEPDVETVIGRKEIASMAHKVAKSKTLIDGLGKDLVAEWKANSKKVDVQRKIIKDELDVLRDEIRQPLTDFENVEKKRIEDHKSLIQETMDAGNNVSDSIKLRGIEAVEERLSEIKKDRSRNWQEFEQIAFVAFDRAIEKFEDAITSKKEADKQAQELAVLRAEKELRDKEDREKLIAENSAKLEAERQKKINADNLYRVEKEKEQAIQHIKNKELAATKEREEKEAFKKSQDKARADDLNHRKKVNNKILSDFIEIGIDETRAMIVMNAIYKGQIANVSINY